VGYAVAFEPVEHAKLVFNIRLHVLYIDICVCVSVARVAVNLWQNLARGLNFVSPWYYSRLDSCVLLTGECIQNKPHICPHASHTACCCPLVSRAVCGLVWLAV
jgi:hypothetical protein